MKSIRTFFALLAVILTAPDVWAQQVPVQVSLPDTLVAAGSVLRVPVLVSDLSGLNVTSSDLLIHYDARLVVAKRIRLTGTKTNRWSQAFRVGLVEGFQDTLGLIDIALATANRVPTGAGTLL